MQRFDELVRGLMSGAVPSFDLESALKQLGPSAHAQLDQLERAERAVMADRFIRNLKSQSVLEATHLERNLLLHLDAGPQGVWSSNLDSAVALVELRNHLKQALTTLGLDWHDVTRVQSLVGGVARWLHTTGGATMDVLSTPDSVDFVLTAKDRQLTPQLVRDSPMVQMLRSRLSSLDVNKENITVEITFSIHRA